MSYHERQGLILSMSELSQECHNFEQDNPYATPQQAFYDQAIFSFVVDEVHAMMQIMCCEVRLCTSLFNPVYSLLFMVLYILTLPGAVLHWMFMSCVPVRMREYPEEREFRSQGIYTAMGTALISLLFCISGLFSSDSIVAVNNQVAVVVNGCIILTAMTSLRAITDELPATMRVFAVSMWLIALALAVLAFLDVYTAISFSWDAALVQFTLRLVELLMCTAVAVRAAQFWDMYADGQSDSFRSGGYSGSALLRNDSRDVGLAVTLVLLQMVVLGGLMCAVDAAEVELPRWDGLW